MSPRCRAEPAEKWPEQLWQQSHPSLQMPTPESVCYPSSSAGNMEPKPQEPSAFANWQEKQIFYLSKSIFSFQKESVHCRLKYTLQLFRYEQSLADFVNVYRKKLVMNEWLMLHLYSALLCIVVCPKRFTIVCGGWGSTLPDFKSALTNSQELSVKHVWYPLTGLDWIWLD